MFVLYYPNFLATIYFKRCHCSQKNVCWELSTFVMKTKWRCSAHVRTLKDNRRSKILMLALSPTNPLLWLIVFVRYCFVLLSWAVCAMLNYFLISLSTRHVCQHFRHRPWWAWLLRIFLFCCERVVLVLYSENLVDGSTYSTGWCF